MKINRNVLCACGSGLKYKHCCINSFVITTRSRIKTYPEKFVIGKLIKNSKTFNNFYQKEREKIKITIYWVESSSNRESFFYLPGNMNGGRHKNEYGETFIILKRIPVSLHDEILIAHELGHILLDLEKFPYIITHENQYEYIASFFSTIIHDFLIDSRLSQFGFNIQKDSLDVYDKHLKELKKINELPSGFVDDYYQILMYVSDAVSYDLFLKNIRTRNLIREITREKFSKIAEIGDRLVEIVNDCEFDTPEKQVKIFNSFIDIFKLQQHLSVKIF